MEKVEELGILTTENAPARSIRILIIDDSSDQLYLNRTFLEMDNYEVVSALSGQEALTLLSEIDEPDLILLDMQMADMSGPEFLIILEQTRPDVFKNVPIVFLTAMDKVPVSKAVGFIRKPFDVENFLKAVHRFIKMGAGHSQYSH